MNKQITKILARLKKGLLVLLGMMLVVGSYDPVLASSVTISEQVDFRAGVLNGVETDSMAGEIRLKMAGEWEQRAWSTPDISLTVGTAVESDGDYVYAIAGGDVWFGRFDPVNNDWKTLTPAPHTAYYGSDLMYLDGKIYAVFGGYQNLFSVYDIENNSWSELATTPDLMYRGASLVTNGTDIWASRGSGTTDFWKYTVASNSWTITTSTPATLSQGASLVYSGGYIYTLRGGGTTTFYRFDVNAGTWTTRTVLPATINDESNAAVKDGYIYVMRNGNTTTLYRYNISGNSWGTITATPQASQYVGLTYNSSDDQIYVFRGNGTYEMWKYDADLGSYSGPTDLSATPGSGADLVYYNGYIYQPRGNNSNAFYRYNVSTKVWSSLATAPGNFNDDTTGVVAGGYLYFFLGSGSTAFYRYDPVGNSWATMTAASVGVRYGGSLAYPGSGDYIYATTGNYTLKVYRYSISGNGWDDDPADLPNNSESSYGARLLSDGTYLYYLSGSRTGALLRLTIGGSWSEVTMLPYAPYWGTDAVYYNGNIYVQAGYYKNQFWRYNIAGDIWQWMSSLNEYYGYDQGPYNGGSLAIDTSSGIMYSILGFNILNMASYTVDPYDYLASGTWTSEVKDLTYVSNWTSLTATVTTPSDSSITWETRTSADRVSWSSWESVVATSIASPTNRYIQIRATLNANLARTQAPTIADVTINYQGDITDPTNPGSVQAFSTEVGGVPLTSGNSYRYNYPYFNLVGASDSGSGLLGYYVYFGDESDGDPETEGNFQTASDYVVTSNLTTGTYYLRIAAKDVAGNVSDPLTIFTYVYEGVVASTVSYSTTAEFATGSVSDVSSSGDELKLASKAGYWMEDQPGLTPVALNQGSGLAYDSENGKVYALRGANSNSFYVYDMATKVWSSKANTLGTVGYGGDLVEGPSGYLYAFRGLNSNTFWRYDIVQNTWDDGAAADSPQSIYYGSALEFDGAQYIYALRGNNDDTFLRYDTSGDEWTNLASVDFGATQEQVNNLVNYGGDLAYDKNDLVYAVQGNTRTGFAAYSISNNTWTQLPKTPAAVYQGGQIEYDATTNAIYLIPGWGKPYFYKYSITDQTWTKLDDGPYTFGLGTGIRNIGGKLLVTRANNSRYVYVYDLVKEKWLVPTRGLFGTMAYGSDVRTIGYGADIVKGAGNYLFMTRGNDDNLFIRYETDTGIVTELAGVPSGVYTGGALVYESTNNKIYATTSNYNNNFYVYDVATNVWSKEELDPLPIDTNTGASLAYDGSRYIYYARGGGGANFYRFDTLGSAGSKWSTLTNITAGVSYGSQLVVKGGYVYVMQGGNSLPNNLYRYDINLGTWSTMASLAARVYIDGFLVDSGGDDLYSCLGGGTVLSCYRYSITSNSWTSIANSPGEIYIGGAATSDGNGKMYVLFGSSGPNSFNNGLYTYVMQSNTTSFEESGYYESAVMDLGEVYRYANLRLGYNTPNNTSINVLTRSSSDNVAWGSYVTAGEEKQVSGNIEYKINSPVERYLQIKIEFVSSDGLYTPSVSEYHLNYYSDTVAPSNASNLSAYNNAAMSASINTDTWYNYLSPHFDWPDAEISGGASDGVGGSAVAGYYVYFGIEPTADPYEDGTYITTSSMTASSLISGNSYYLRIKSKDDAGNVSDSTWAPFVYKFDNEAPEAPADLAADPSGYSSVNDFDFSWGSVSDTASGGVTYCYKTGTSSGPLASDQCTSATSVTDITGYQTGTNTFYVRAVDAANNYSAYTPGSYYFNNGAPSAPTNLSVTPTSNTVNSFEFSWSAPSAYYGSLSNLKYYYSVNALPTVASVVRAYSNSLGASSYATLPGLNTLYVVVMDEAGNIDYDAYESVTFEANTTAPGAPTNVDIADVSVKATSSWKLALSWEEPSSLGAGVASYEVWRSTDGESYAKRASTSGISYVDTQLSQLTYYYKIRACDSANNCGVYGDVVSLLPDGKFVSAAPLVAEPEVSNITTKKATISWTTSRTADSKIAYGIGSNDYFDEEVGNSDQVTAHSLVVNNLSPGTTYYFTAKWTDEDGNLGSSEEYSFATAPAPSAKEVKAVSVSLDSAIIQFTSSNASRAKVYYGPTTAFGGYTEVGVGTAESTYSVPITGLLDGTKYFYKISFFDTEGNEYEGDTYSFETLPRPKIEALKLQQVKGTATGTVLITWSTNTEVSSIVTYYPSANPGAAQDKVDLKLAKAHRIIIEGLLPNTAYTLLVKGKDKVGNEASSAAQNFTTATDTRPPTIANLKVEPVVQGVGEEATVQLVVSWDTDELSTSQVTFGEGSSGELSNKTQLDASRTFNHMVVISNLVPSKVYHLRALSLDEGGNEAVSVDRVVITPTATKSALNLVVSNLSQAFGFLGGISQ